jgi:hypothetical protein
VGAANATPTTSSFFTKSLLMRLSSAKSEVSSGAVAAIASVCARLTVRSHEFRHTLARDSRRNSQ